MPRALAVQASLFPRRPEEASSHEMLRTTGHAWDVQADPGQRFPWKRGPLMKCGTSLLNWAPMSRRLRPQLLAQVTEAESAPRSRRHCSWQSRPRARAHHGPPHSSSQFQSLQIQDQRHPGQKQLPGCSHLQFHHHHQARERWRTAAIARPPSSGSRPSSRRRRPGVADSRSSPVMRLSKMRGT